LGLIGKGEKVLGEQFVIRLEFFVTGGSEFIDSAGEQFLASWNRQVGG
jgi:hypothetical protein